MRFPVALFGVVSLLLSASGAARATAFPFWPDTQVVGEIRHIRIRGDETLRDVAAQFGVSLDELERLNVGVDTSRPGPGTWITLPTQFVLPDVPRVGVVINLAERRLYYYAPSLLGRGAEVMTFPVTLGQRDWTGMLGTTRVEAKVSDAASSVPVKQRHDSGAPADRVGVTDDVALRLEIPGCLMQAISPYIPIGRLSVPVCLGLQPNDLKLLFEEVQEGTSVRIVDQPYKAGWRDGVLFLESHASFAGESSRTITPAVRAVINATTEKKPPIDWELVRRSAEQASGVPVRISR